MASQVIIILASVAPLLSYFFPHAVIVPIKPESILHRNSHSFGIVTPNILPFGRLATIFIGSGSNSPAFPNASTLKLLQYGQEFDSAHALHSDIVTKGSGRFSHWGDNVVFSTPYNTSAVDNGRIYAVARSISPRWWIPISLVAIGVLWLCHTLTSARRSPQDGGQRASHYRVRACPAENDTAAMNLGRRGNLICLYQYRRPLLAPSRGTVARHRKLPGLVVVSYHRISRLAQSLHLALRRLAISFQFCSRACCLAV